MDPILVTGGSGFIGRRLVAELLRRGAPLVLLQRPRPAPTPVPDVETIHVAEFTPDLLASALKGRRFSSVYHLAAYGVMPDCRDAVRMMNVNVVATLALVDIAARSGASSMVIAGSSAEYAPSADQVWITESHPLETAKVYGASKAAAGIAALALAQALQLPLANARLFNVYGPGEGAHRLLPCLLQGFLKNRPVGLSPGTQVRDFVFVDDAIDAVLLLGQALQRSGLPVAGAYNVATGQPFSVREFALTAARVAGGDADLLRFGEIDMRPDEILWLVGNSDLLHRRTGWRSRFSVEDGLTVSIKQEAPN